MCAGAGRPPAAAKPALGVEHDGSRGRAATRSSCWKTRRRRRRERRRRLHGAAVPRRRPPRACSMAARATPPLGPAVLRSRAAGDQRRAYEARQGRRRAGGRAGARRGSAELRPATRPPGRFRPGPGRRRPRGSAAPRRGRDRCGAAVQGLASQSARRFAVEKSRKAKRTDRFIFQARSPARNTISKRGSIKPTTATPPWVAGWKRSPLWRPRVEKPHHR